ncbi:homoserine kinase [Flavobacterium sp. '19STA2R22 D10 B1']|uniref:homoserine kinase n=1 Tax=Flavobacterium aerium TaxID=3037261 RepID=UPI00278C4AF0|nr:homoserine kinase [Flavobacterium sp. '19STA2R22 D10 B1']
MESIKIFCPATIANLSCGFDVLGVCLDTIGDEMIVRKVKEKGIRINKIEGADLPFEAEKNVAGVAAMAMLAVLDIEYGFEISIHKKISAGSGIGSSAASASGAVFAINQLLGNPFSLQELVVFAMEGERLASGSAHADNVAPALFGGFTLIRSYEPLDIIKINAPDALFASVIHPQIEVKTIDARSILKQKIELKKAINQCGNIAGLISGLYTQDYALIGRSLHDEIVEPIRSILIPKYDEMKKAALDNGALGCGISGSGPSVFVLSKSEKEARNAVESMGAVLDSIELGYQIHVSKINAEGIKIIETNII